MPRVKAITTGSIPSFLDVILNFAESDTTSSLAGQDSWLAQMRVLGEGHLLMYGDDTWLKLFPGFFSRADGTSSFFVSDFTEVDNNVTRHLPAELLENDWSTLILHYLGLDHIGHKAGPRSPNMASKQMEMDQVVKAIYDAIESQDHLQSTLFVLCGDHGMNDAGNHGGSTPGETSPALVFLSPKLKGISGGVACPTVAREDFDYYTTVEQSDLVPTLAGLLGFPVPLNNLGIFIPSFLKFWERDSDRIELLSKNSQQILRLLMATFPAIPFNDQSVPLRCIDPASDLEQLACKWREVVRRLEYRPHTSAVSAMTLSALTEFSKLAQGVMSNTASNYNLPRLEAGIGTALLATFFAAVAMMGVLSKNPLGSGLVIISAIYGGMMFASSYVEEEQHFWYWVASSWVVYLSINEATALLAGPSGWSSIGILVALRLCRRWNQTGQKYAGGADIAKGYLHTHSLTLWCAVTATYAHVAFCILKKNYDLATLWIMLTVSTTLCGTALWFKMAFTKADAPELLRSLPHILVDQLSPVHLLIQVRAVFVGLGLLSIYTAICESDGLRKARLSRREDKNTLHNLLTLFLATQSRAANIPLFLLFETQYRLLRQLRLSAYEVTMTSILFQYVSFFAFGGSNSISSVDLSNAYNGVSGYNVAAVGALTFASNWAGPIWWASATNKLLVRRHSAGEKSVLLNHLAAHTLFVTLSLSFIMAACTVLRTHLFIWTVFSPKYLYCMAWCLAQHLCITIFGGTTLFLLSAR